MKKLIVMLTLACLIFSSVDVCFADGGKPCHENLENDIKQIENVRDCKVLCFSGYCFVALRTQGIATKTIMNELTEKVTALITEKCPRVEHVFVSTSVKTYSALERLSYENIWGELTDLFDIDQNEYPLPKIRPMPFKQDKPEGNIEKAEN